MYVPVVHFIQAIRVNIACHHNKLSLIQSRFFAMSVTSRWLHWMRAM